MGGRSAEMPEKLSKPVVVLVEGSDEQLFLEGLFAHMGIADVEVIEVKGKDKFPSAFAAFVIDPGFSDVRSFAIVRDADTSVDASLQSVKDLLAKHNQPVPSSSGGFAQDGQRRVGVFIMPGNADSGMLEDLCLQTVADDPAMQCVEAAFTCIKSALLPSPQVDPVDLSIPYLPKNLSKSKALLFLATRYRPMSSVGWAAKHKVWKLDHPALTAFKSFVSDLIKVG
jgi:hypothetical protein